MNLTEEFKNPPVKYRIKPFWFWNGEMTKEEIEYQIREMAEKGLGGLFICARQGMTIPYLSTEWFEMVDYACQTAETYKMEAWLYDEYPYPSGMSGGEVLLEHPEAEHMVLNHKRFFSEGGLVEADLGWSHVLYARAVPVSEGEALWDKAVDLKESVGIIQTEKIYQKTGLTKYNNKRFFSYGPRKILKTTLPKGNWRLEIYTEASMGDFKYYGGFFDPCNEDAVDTFLNTTHERYRKALGQHFGTAVYGMFSDEVGLLSPIPWSKLLPAEFEKRNGYSLVESLPALHDHTIKNASKIRYDLYETAHILFRRNYHEKVAGWCKENQLSYVTEVPSMRLGTQRFSDVIGGDTAHEKLGKPLEWIYDEYIRNYRSNARAVSSLTRQLNKSQAMIESFHSVGWTMTLQDAKWMIDRLGAEGINFYNFHAFYYTIADITKHDAPPSQFIQNPYWKYYGKLADLVGRMGAMISNTEAEVSVAVLDPVASLWTRLGNPFHGFPYSGECGEEEKQCNRLRDDWVHICKNLLFEQIPYEHLDSEILKEAAVEEGRIKIGRASYSVLILPPSVSIEDWVLPKIKEFAAQGGCVIGLGLLPCEPIGRDETPDLAYSEFFHTENVNFQNYWADSTAPEDKQKIVEQGNVYFLPASGGIKNAGYEKKVAQICEKYLDSNVRIQVDEEKRKQAITAVRKEGQDSLFVFAANQGEGPVTFGITWKGQADYTAETWSMEDGTAEVLQENIRERISITLGSYESQWIHLTNNPKRVCGEKSEKVKNKLRLNMREPWNVRAEGPNVLRFSKIQISLDQENWKEGEAMTFVEQCQACGLLKEDGLRFTGAFGTPKKISPAYPLTCCYRAEFQAEKGGIKDDLAFLMDKETIAGSYKIWINEHLITEKDFRRIRINDQNNQICPISSYVEEGRNVILIEVEIGKDEDGLRDPFYLIGSFGVRENCLTALPETACPRQSWCEGFPYYSGTLVFEKEIFIDKNQIQEPFSLTLDTEKPLYDCVEVMINGFSLGAKAYTPYLWKGERRYLKEGANLVAVKVTNTLANMLDGMYFDYDTHSLVEIKP
ncbi:MAG TPA: hypothetical protein H9740_08255 [Candidatus Hungatella pullicola]|nr:hypothetical protein [Candidatus Hungatella pullicola]